MSVVGPCLPVSFQNGFNCVQFLSQCEPFIKNVNLFSTIENLWICFFMLTKIANIVKRCHMMKRVPHVHFLNIWSSSKYFLLKGCLETAPPDLLNGSLCFLNPYSVYIATVNIKESYKVWTQSTSRIFCIRISWFVYTREAIVCDKVNRLLESRQLPLYDSYWSNIQPQQLHCSACAYRLYWTESGQFLWCQDFHKICLKSAHQRSIEGTKLQAFAQVNKDCSRPYSLVITLSEIWA